MKATHLQQAATIEETLLGNAVVPFINDGEHRYSIKEIKSESQMQALFEKETNIRLKNLICGIKLVTMSIKNYIIAEVTADMAGFKATNACLNRVRQFYSKCPFVVPAQCVEVWPFPTSATLT
ncbi:MAG: hypothetical protein EZS28_017984 [Streblomastix strix]|uniref:Uncharacterized protein n=1 Tax=Streblomastix strix TaxID=222440 RepID=A0A5J4VVA4_9EUKA|nr:MAG: hypothetical protein EZS28_017984 [Streblomastix strix]